MAAPAPNITQVITPLRPPPDDERGTLTPPHASRIARVHVPEAASVVIIRTLRNGAVHLGALGCATYAIHAHDISQPLYVGILMVLVLGKAATDVLGKLGAIQKALTGAGGSTPSALVLLGAALHLAGRHA